MSSALKELIMIAREMLRTWKDQQDFIVEAFSDHMTVGKEAILKSFDSRMQTLSKSLEDYENEMPGTVDESTKIKALQANPYRRLQEPPPQPHSDPYADFMQGYGPGPGYGVSTPVYGGHMSGYGQQGGYYGGYGPSTGYGGYQMGSSNGQGLFGMQDGSNYTSMNKQGGYGNNSRGGRGAGAGTRGRGSGQFGGRVQSGKIQKSSQNTPIQVVEKEGNPEFLKDMEKISKYKNLTGRDNFSVALRERCPGGPDTVTKADLIICQNCCGLGHPTYKCSNPTAEGHVSKYVRMTKLKVVYKMHQKWNMPDNDVIWNPPKNLPPKPIHKNPANLIGKGQHGSSGSKNIDFSSDASVMNSMDDDN